MEIHLYRRVCSIHFGVHQKIQVHVRFIRFAVVQQCTVGLYEKKLTYQFMGSLIGKWNWEYGFEERSVNV